MTSLFCLTDILIIDIEYRVNSSGVQKMTKHQLYEDAYLRAYSATDTLRVLARRGDRLTADEISDYVRQAMEGIERMREIDVK